MEQKKLEALLLLAGIEHSQLHKLANKYWPDVEAYAQIRRDNPWWLVVTKAGPLVIGWRKRVIEIDWEGTGVRAKMTNDENVTSELTYCHAWSYSKALQYLMTLKSALVTTPPAPPSPNEQEAP